MSGAHTQKKLPMKSQLKAIVEKICRGVQYERLERHLFLDFSADNEIKDVPIWGYFRFIHALHLLPAVFQNSFFVADKLIFKISYSIYFDYFSTCSSISRSTMQTKTFRFGNISDSATRSTSYRKFIKIHLSCGESPTLYSK